MLHSFKLIVSIFALHCTYLTCHKIHSSIHPSIIGHEAGIHPGPFMASPSQYTPFTHTLTHIWGWFRISIHIHLLLVKSHTDRTCKIQVKPQTIFCDTYITFLLHGTYLAVLHSARSSLLVSFHHKFYCFSTPDWWRAVMWNTITKYCVKSQMHLCVCLCFWFCLWHEVKFYWNGIFI